MSREREREILLYVITLLGRKPEMLSTHIRDGLAKHCLLERWRGPKFYQLMAKWERDGIFTYEEREANEMVMEWEKGGDTLPVVRRYYSFAHDPMTMRGFKTLIDLDGMKKSVLFDAVLSFACDRSEGQSGATALVPVSGIPLNHVQVIMLRNIPGGRDLLELFGKKDEFGGLGSKEAIVKLVWSLIVKLSPCNTDDILQAIPRLCPHSFDGILRRFVHDGMIAIEQKVTKTETGITREYPEIKTLYGPTGILVGNAILNIKGRDTEDADLEDPKISWNN